MSKPCNGWVYADEAGAAGLCGAKEGELHRLGCPYERCTQCTGRFLSCDCPEDYDQRRRVPFFRLTWHRCERCGTAWPAFFNVPNDVWQHYILSLGHGDKMLCLHCFNLIAELTDGAAYAREHGGAVMLNEIKPDAPLGSEARKQWDLCWGDQP